LGEFVFATDARGAALGALATTAASIRGLGLGRRHWFVVGDSTKLGASRRVVLGDDPAAEWVVFVAPGDKVARDALHFARTAAADVDVIYGDTRHEIKREDRLPTYQRRPSFSPERLRAREHAPDELAQGSIDHLVPRDAALADEGLADHPGREMGLILGLDHDEGAGQAGTDEFSYFFGVHAGAL